MPRAEDADALMDIPPGGILERSKGASARSIEEIETQERRAMLLKTKLPSRKPSATPMTDRRVIN